MSPTKYTLIQHSGSYAGNWEFDHAVEERSIVGAEATAILKAGGLVFDTYNDATEAQERYNYPSDVTGLIPHAKGRFTDVAGFRIFIPDLMAEIDEIMKDLDG
jgi:hypothetical protein